MKLMRKLRIVLIAGIFALVIFGYTKSTDAATCTLTSGTWSKSVVNLGQAVTIQVSSKDCGSRNVLIKLFGKSGSESFAISSKGHINPNSSDITVSTSGGTFNISFTAADFQGEEGDIQVTFTAQAMDGSSNSITSSILNVTQAAGNKVTGISGFSFDVLPGVQPKILPSDNKLAVELKLSINLGQFGQYCGDTNLTSFLWSVYEEGYPGTLDQFIYPGGISNTGKVETFDRSSAVVTRTLTTTVTALPYPEGHNYMAMPIYAIIECGNTNSTGIIHKNAAQSSPVNVTIPKGDLIYSCVAPDGNYACSKDNLSSCSDVVGGGPQCGQTCKQIRSSLCSTKAPAGGATPGTGPGGSGPGSGSSGSESESYTYEISNPLRGGPNNLFDIINIAAKWIFNISIPLVVMFILYAGFLMLTAGPVPANVTKAKGILWNVVLGLAIIFIGRGFITLIYSVIELGGSDQESSLGGEGAACAKHEDCKSALICDTEDTQTCKTP